MYNLSLNFVVNNLFSLKVKQFIKNNFYLSMFTNIYFYRLWLFLLILFFFEVVHILLSIIIMHHIFLTNLLFKFLILLKRLS